MNENSDSALVPKPRGALEKANPRAKRILSGMVADVLAAVRVDLDALVQEGKRIQRGEGMTREDIRAFHLFHRAAVAGNREALFLVYSCYLNGEGVRLDSSKALDWLRKSAESGFSEAQCKFGNICYGETLDFVEAVKWYRKAATQGNAVGQCSLGVCYYYGKGVERDYSTAVEWFRKAAEQGNVTAQKSLGHLYAKGEGVPQDHDEAAKWYQKAAEQKNAEAQSRLRWYEQAMRRLSRRLGLPIGREVEVWLKDGVRLRGMLTLKPEKPEDIPETVCENDLKLVIGKVSCKFADMESCLRVDPPNQESVETHHRPHNSHENPNDL